MDSMMIGKMRRQLKDSKLLSDKKKYPKCEVCGYNHPQHDNDYPLFDCWNYKIKMRKKKNEKNKI